MNAKIKKLQKINFFVNIMTIISLIMAYFFKIYYFFALFVFLFIVKDMMIWNFCRKNLKFTTYYIRDNVLYKIGLFPKGIRKQSVEMFLTDNFPIILGLKKWYSFLHFGIFDNNDNYESSYPSCRRLLITMEKLSNQEYLNKLLNNEVNDQPFKIHKITQIYSYNYNEETKRFNLICDSIDMSNNLNYAKADIVLNTFENDTDLKKYLIYNSSNTVVNEEEYL